MTNYSKIMKKFEKQNYEVSLFDFEDLSKLGSYPEKMKELYKVGYTQVIINSKLMLMLLELIINQKNWEFIDFEISDPSLDEETENQIKKISGNIKNKEIAFSNVKEYLFWVFDEGSIFIDKIIVYNYKEKNNIEINSNGLIYGDNNNEIFNQIIKKILEGYLNE